MPATRVKQVQPGVWEYSDGSRRNAKGALVPGGAKGRMSGRRFGAGQPQGSGPAPGSKAAGSGSKGHVAEGGATLPLSPQRRAAEAGLRRGMGTATTPQAWARVAERLAGIVADPESTAQAVTQAAKLLADMAGDPKAKEAPLPRPAVKLSAPAARSLAALLGAAEASAGGGGAAGAAGAGSVSMGDPESESAAPPHVGYGVTWVEEGSHPRDENSGEKGPPPQFPLQPPAPAEEQEQDPPRAAEAAADQAERRREELRDEETLRGPHLAAAALTAESWGREQELDNGGDGGTIGGGGQDDQPQ